MMKALKHKLTEVLVLKNSVNEMKDELQSTGSRDRMEQRDSKFKDRMIQVNVRTELRFFFF